MTYEKPSIKNKRTNEALAVLISSTRSKKRNISLIEMAQWLEVAINDLGSIDAVADRIGLTSKMLKQFLAVRSLLPEIQILFRDRKLDSVDAAVHLLLLDGNDQKALSRVLANEQIDTKDLRAVVELRKTEKSMSIQSVINEVLKGKTRKEFIAEFVVRGHKSKENIMHSLIKYIPKEEIIRIDIEGAIGLLVVTLKGKQCLSAAAKTLHVPLKNVIPLILAT